MVRLLPISIAPEVRLIFLPLRLASNTIVSPPGAAAITSLSEPAPESPVFVTVPAHALAVQPNKQTPATPSAKVRRDHRNASRARLTPAGSTATSSALTKRDIPPL